MSVATVAAAPIGAVTDLPAGTIVRARRWHRGTRLPEVHKGIVVEQFSDDMVVVWFPALGKFTPGSSAQALFRREILRTVPLAQVSRKSLARLARITHRSHGLSPVSDAVRAELTRRKESQRRPRR